MRYFSTFSGIGGFEIGIQNAYAVRNKNEGDANIARRFTHNLSQLLQKGGQRPVCVGYSEIDKYATQVYEYNFEGAKNYGDITKIKAEELPDFECLVGGFPCQAFSIAGKRAGFADTRGTLFFDLARILRAKQPRLFVFENVKGLLSHDGGQTFKTIIEAVDDLGYDCQWQVLNSKDFGVPQNRERIIIVGHLRGTPRPEVFPLAPNPEADLVLPTLTARYYGAQANGGYISHKSPKVGTYRTHKDGQGFRAVKSGVVPTIPARAREDGSGQPVVMIGSTQKNAKVSDDGVSPTLTSAMGMGGGHVPMLSKDVRIRRLTPLECERLQAFPDNWTMFGKGGVVISDSQRYKMCGNAVTTNVVQAVFERLF